MDARDERRAITIAGGMIALGIALRAWALVQRGSLWQDEAALALNILGRSYGALLAPLDWAQAAPPAYLWLTRAIATTFGGAEWALRAGPFLAGVALLPLMVALARRLAGPWAAAIALAVAACSQFALRFATEAKPYMVDAAVAAALLVLAAVVRDASSGSRAWRALALAGLLAMPLSIPAVFVLAAIVLALAIEGGWRSDPAARRRLLATGALWAAGFGVLYVVVLRSTADNAYLRAFWAPVMLDPFAPKLAMRVQWVFLHLTWYPFRMTSPVAGLVAGVAAWVAGLVALARRRPSGACLLGGPPLLALIASVLGRYPLSERLALFAIPAIWIAQAAAVAWLLGRHRAGPRLLSTVACAVLAIATLQDAWGFLRAPGAFQPTRELFETVDARSRREGTPVYVHARAGAVWIYTTTDWRAPDLDRIARYRDLSSAVDAAGFENLSRARAVRPGEGDPLVLRAGDRVELIGLAAGMHHRKIGRPDPPQPSPGWAAEEVRRLGAAAQPDVWLVASHVWEGTGSDELAPLLAAVGASGLEVVEELRGGVDAVALRLRRS